MNEEFKYKYSAPTSAERKEIESIRNNYIQSNQSTDKLLKLRQLDNKVRNIPIMISLIFGIIGLLIFGLGMTFVLEWNNLIIGIVISVIGIFPISFAYPIYRKTLTKLKNKYSGEIIKLSDELLNDDK